MSLRVPIGGKWTCCAPSSIPKRGIWGWNRGIQFPLAFGTPAKEALRLKHFWVGVRLRIMQYRPAHECENEGYESAVRLG